MYIPYQMQKTASRANYLTTNQGGRVMKSDTVIINDELQRYANRVARASGHLRADQIVWGDTDKVLRHRPHGYRKYTTGEYVSNAYRNNFGWKNTYYCKAYTVVMLAI